MCTKSASFGKCHIVQNGSHFFNYVCLLTNDCQIRKNCFYTLLPKVHFYIRQTHKPLLLERISCRRRQNVRSLTWHFKISPHITASSPPQPKTMPSISRARHYHRPRRQQFHFGRKIWCKWQLCCLPGLPRHGNAHRIHGKRSAYKNPYLPQLKLQHSTVAHLPCRMLHKGVQLR